MLKFKFKFVISTFITLILFGCSSIEELPIIDKVTQPDYVSSKKSKKLELPPEMDEISTSNKYLIDGQPTSLKNYQNKDQNLEIQKFLKEQQNKIKVVKAGTMRWLVVPAELNNVWPAVESFWEDMGFDINSSKSKGIIETRWISETDLNKDESNLGKFDAWLDSLSNTATRRKFRTRIEDGIEEGTTEIYLSQRSVLNGLEDHLRTRESRKTFAVDEAFKIEKYKDPDNMSDENGKEIKSNFKEDDLEIQYELLRRLMVKLGASDLTAREKLDNAIEIKKAELVNEVDHKYIILNDKYSRAWRRLNLAIDMVGFLVEDKNRQDGIFYIKYSNLEIEESENKTKKKKGLISKLAFWEDDEVLSEEEDPEGQEMYRKEIEGEDQDKVSSADSDKTWSEKFSFWGGDEENDVPEGEKRFRIRIVEIDDGAKVYIDYPNESLNKTKTAQSIISILYDYLKT
jgi:outer membrane protein assembly factor BamC